MSSKNTLKVALLVTALAFSPVAFAEETTLEKAEVLKNETLDSTKEVYRNAQDEMCQLQDGKMKCFGRKMKHKAESLYDKTKTKAKEMKNKIN